MAATGSFNWHTRIGNFKFANCGVQVNDFSITPNPTTQTVVAGSSPTYMINTMVLSGTAETINPLMVSGLPAGVTATFNPTSVTAGGSSTLTVTVPAGTAASTSTLTITAMAPSKTHTTTVSLTVVNNDFSITVTPTSQTVNAGASTTYTINTAVTSGAAQTINLSASGLPAGVTASFNPASVTAGGSSTLTVTVPAGTAASTSTLTIAGSGPSKTHTTTVSLTITNQPPTVTFTSPTNGQTVSGTISVSVNATDADGTVASVKFDLPDGTSVTDTTSPYSTTFDTTKVANGNYTIKATATDNQNATTVATVPITVHNNVPPTVSITSPTNSSTVSGTVTVVASAADSDGFITMVAFDLPDGTSVAATATPFSAVFDSTKVPNGSHTITATATDNQNATTVTSVTITVTNCLNNPISAMDVPIAIPDNDPVGITSSIPVTGNGTIASLSLSLNIAHPFRGDLSVILISPDSTRFNVSNRLGGSSDTISFTDLSIAAFNGQVAAGTWKLQVQDLALLSHAQLRVPSEIG